MKNLGRDPAKSVGPHFDWLKKKISESLKLNVIKRADRSQTMNYASNIEQLMTYHFLKDRNENQKQARIRNGIYELDHDDPDFTMRKLKQSCEQRCYETEVSKNKGKASGMNGIPMEIIDLLYSENN